MDSQATHEAFMAEALAEARRARDAGEVPVGAVIVNEHECAEIFGRPQPAELARRKVTNLIVTRGAEPTLWINASGRREFPAHPVRPVDTVGAGDAFAGTLAALSIDTIALSVGDRVLVKDQPTTAQNGIYTVTTVGSVSVAWVLTRASDADVWNDLVAALTAIEQGTTNDDTFWMSEIARGGTLGTTAITWQLVSNQQLASLGALATTGLTARTAANTFATRSIAVSGTGLSVSNADGVAGDPTVTSNATSANTASTVIARDASGAFSITSFAYSGNPTSTSTGAIQIPFGTTAQRPTAATGQIRFNSTITQFEGYNGTAWSSIGGGATGGGADQVFLENGQTVTTNYSLTAGKNAVSAGPVTVNSGVTVTVPSGASWVIV